MPENLKKDFLKGIFWTSIEKAGTVLLQVIIGIILTRLLFPKDFGLIAMVFIIIAVSNILIDGGFNLALVRENKIKQNTFSSVFVFNLFSAFIIYGIIYLLAPLIAQFFQEETLTPIVRILSLSIPIKSFSLIQIVILERNLDFKKISFNYILSGLASGIIAIILAYSGYGVWALVFQTLSSVFISTVLFWITSSWKLSLKFDLHEIKRIFPFSINVLTASIINSIYENLSSILIGKCFNPQSVGYYTQGKKLQNLPITGITSIISRVLYPSFSKIDDNERLKRVFRKTLTTTVFIIFPLSCLLIVCAKPLIILLFTEKWIKSVIYVQILAFGGMLYPLHLFNLQIYLIKGSSNIFLKIEIIKKTIGITIMFISIKYGIIYLVIFEALSSYILYFVNAYYNGKLIKYKIREQMLDVIPIFAVSIISGCIAYPFISISKYLIFNISLSTFVYIVTFAAASFLFCKETTLDFFNLVKNKLGKRYEKD